MVLLWWSHLAPPTWWECEVVNSPQSHWLEWKQRPAVPPVVWSQCISALRPADTTSRRMNPCYCAWESKGETNQAEIFISHIFLSISRDAERGEEQELVVYLHTMALYIWWRKKINLMVRSAVLLNWSWYLISPENWKIIFQHRPDRGSVVSLL